MNLVIIESPGKIEKLSAILGDSYQVVACNGHVRDLPAREMGFTAPDFIPEYEVSERSEGIIKRLARLCGSADKIYLATDPDREGEAISWHLEQAVKIKSYLRVAWGEITEQEVMHAMQKPRLIDRLLVAGQETRRNADRLVGYMVSGLASDAMGLSASAGRVQSPAVKIIVENERAIRSFKKTNHFGVRVIYTSPTGEQWFADWQTKPFVTPESPYVMDRNFAESVASIKEFSIIEYKESDSKRNPPAPFITTTLLQAASTALKMNPKETMDLAQNLFDNGHITYHRTDNPNVSDESLGDIYEAATKLGLAMADEPRRFDAGEDAQAGHPATTPTHWDVEVAGDTPEHQALYKLIRLRAIASQLSEATFAVRTVTLQATEPGTGQLVTFVARGRTLVDPGWLALVDGDQTEEGDDGEAVTAKEEPKNPIPQLTNGESLQSVNTQLLEKSTKAPKRFTRASHIGELKRLGIGRPGTSESIQTRIFDHEYVTEKGRFMHATGKGELLVDTLDGRFSFMDYNYTRQIERDIDKVAKGQSEYREVMQSIYDHLNNEIAVFKATVKPKVECPKCESAMRRIPGPKGHFWGCTNYPECKHTYQDKNGEPVKVAPLELSEHTCGKCQSPLIHFNQPAAPGKAAFNFWICSSKKGCKTKYADKNGVPAK